jgi:hypothetical protein
MTYRALLIGNSVFDADAGLTQLTAPVQDVARLHRALVDAEVGLFDDADVRQVTERGSSDILDELDRFFSEGRGGDLLLFYYSGHAIVDERDQLHLCGRYTHSDGLLTTGISNTRINEFIAQSGSQRTVILLDCCTSGRFKSSPIGGQLAGSGRFIVTSARGAALANDADPATGSSVFTHHFVEGLLGAAPDANGDGFIDLRDLYECVRRRMLAATEQVLQCRFDGDAAVSLARVRATPRHARAPAAMRPGEPTFALAENTITVRDVEPDEQLPPEIIEVVQLGNAPLDLDASTNDDWLQATVSTAAVVVELRPRPGSNRGMVTIRDRASGTVQVLRVKVDVRSPSVPARVEASARGGAGRVFISYRREETAYAAGWLHHLLADRFGREQIFADVDSIALGDNFVEVIRSAVGSSDVLLALIGAQWLTMTDEHGRRRLDNPDDFVRLEIEAALARNVRVIPILVSGARMPRGDELPPSLAELVHRQALELSHSRFDTDTSRLLNVLDTTLADIHGQSVEPQTSIRLPPASKPSPTSPGAASPDEPEVRARDGVLDEDVQFSVYRPRRLAAERWADLLVFAHKTDPVPDPRGGQINPLEVVENRARAVFDGQGVQIIVDAARSLVRGSSIRIVPELPGVECNPRVAELAWLEPVHEAHFRILAPGKLGGTVVRGWVRVWCGPVIIGEVSMMISVDPVGAQQAVATLESEKLVRYRKIFPSYSRADGTVVELFAVVARAVGDEYLQDVLTLRSGEEWNHRLLELIDDADVFQLFWSSNSLHSPYCRMEWEKALALRRPGFIRPVYWEEPLPSAPALDLPPEGLRRLHFAKVPGLPFSATAELPQIICYNCGAHNNTGRRFCASCGADLRAPSAIFSGQPPQSRPTADRAYPRYARRGPGRLALVLLLVLIIIIVGAIIYIGSV